MKIDPKKEVQKITKFIKNTLKKEGFEKVVIGLSGGIDSATSLYLLKKSIPKENIIVSHLYYFEPLNLEPIIYGIPTENIHNFSIKTVVDGIFHLLHLRGTDKGVRLLDRRGGRMDSSEVDRVRLGNITARIRMIMFYDLAKKNNALVCGTENRSEHLLGYYTRFGDEASDFEPIKHLYKTQVYQLAGFLNVPKSIIEQEPTAGLWLGQTDEGQFGFTYKEADQVMRLYFDKKESVNEIEQKGFKNAQKIIDFCQKNAYKYNVPYTIK